MNRKYYGCESAASATAKIEIVNPYSDTTTTKIFFDDEEEMFDYYEKLKQKGNKDNLYYCYIREVLNWETGRLGGWQICKSNWG